MGGLSDNFRRLANLLEPEIERMAAKQAMHIGAFDDARYDAPQGLVTFSRRGEVVWRCHAEALGRLDPANGLFNWWWHKPSAAKSRLDPIVTEGHGYQLVELTRDHVEGVNELEAHQLARVGAQLARAEGVLRLVDAAGVDFIALFEGGPPRYSVQMPAVVPNSASFAPHVHTMPPTPVAEVQAQAERAAPAEPAVARVPPREIVTPLVNAALEHVTRHSAEFERALVVVVVETQDGRRRFFVHIVTTDASGELSSLDATRDLVDKAKDVIAKDAMAGGGHWRKLLVRLRRTSRGAQVEVDVRG
jgi:hypothetical protein